MSQTHTATPPPTLSCHIYSRLATASGVSASVVIVAVASRYGRLSSSSENNDGNTSIAVAQRAEIVVIVSAHVVIA